MLVVLVVRRHVPESPRWLLLHGHARRAREVVDDIERAVGRHVEAAPVRVHVTGRVGLAHLARALFVRYPRRTILGAVLMFSQAILYNAVFFSSALVLRTFYGVAPSRVGLYLVPVAIGNFVGPLVLGPLFDPRPAGA